MDSNVIDKSTITNLTPAASLDIAMSPSAKRARTPSLDVEVRTMDFALISKRGICCTYITTDGTSIVCTCTAIFSISKGHLAALIAGHETESGYKNGIRGEARFNSPQGMVVSGTNIFVSDTFNHVIRQVTFKGVVSTIAGSGSKGFANAIGVDALFNRPWGILVDDSDCILVADKDNHCVRQIKISDFSVSTFVGSAGKMGYANGKRQSARLFSPMSLAVHKDGNLLIADTGNNCIRKLTLAQGLVTTLAGCAGQSGFADANGTAALFHHPHGITVDGDGNILVADTKNNSIRIISGTNLRVSTIAGALEGGNADGANARFVQPTSLIVNSLGKIIVTEAGRCSQRVLFTKLTPPKYFAIVEPEQKKHVLQSDFEKLHDDDDLCDVTFAVQGQRIHAHRCVLAARCVFFCGLFTSGRTMNQGGAMPQDKDIVIDDVSAGAFRALKRFLYTHIMPDREDCGEGLAVGEMVQVADRFQVPDLYVHSLKLFAESLTVDNVVERLITAADAKLASMQKEAMLFFQENVSDFQVFPFTTRPYFRLDRFIEQRLIVA